MLGDEYAVESRGLRHLGGVKDFGPAADKVRTVWRILWPELDSELQ
jgi:hypothetical protein